MIYHSKNNWKKVDLAKLISDKTELKAKSIYENKARVLLKNNKKRKIMDKYIRVYIFGFSKLCCCLMQYEQHCLMWYSVCAEDLL